MPSNTTAAITDHQKASISPDPFRANALFDCYRGLRHLGNGPLRAIGILRLLNLTLDEGEWLLTQEIIINLEGKGNPTHAPRKTVPTRKPREVRSQKGR